MQLEKVFDLEDLSRNTGSSDRCVEHPIVSLTTVLLGRFLFDTAWLVTDSSIRHAICTL